MNFNLDYDVTSIKAYVYQKHEDNKIITFERGNLFWVFNFHPTRSFTDYKVGVSRPGKYKIVLDSDRKEFGGFERITQSKDYFTQTTPYDNSPQCLMVILKCFAFSR